jgi:anti-anti-sigma regulatory factor
MEIELLVFAQLLYSGLYEVCMHCTFNIADGGAEERSSTSHFTPTLVLQPMGHLDRTAYQEFRALLESALDQPVYEVIIDFLWVETVDEHGIQTLLAGMERAAKLGKTISFAAMSCSIRAAVEAEWDRQRQLRLGSWQDLFGSDLEEFLDAQLAP